MEIKVGDLLVGPVTKSTVEVTRIQSDLVYFKYLLTGCQGSDTPDFVKTWAHAPKELTSSRDELTLALRKIAELEKQLAEEHESNRLGYAQGVRQLARITELEKQLAGTKAETEQ